MRIIRKAGNRQAKTISEADALKNTLFRSGEIFCIRANSTSDWAEYTVELTAAEIKRLAAFVERVENPPAIDKLRAARGRPL